MTILDPKPVTTAAIDGVVRDKINQAGSATQVALSATFVPKWKPTTAYLAGDKVLNPSGDVVSAKAAFTSGASYSAANWDQSETVTGKLDKTEASSTYAPAKGSLALVDGLYAAAFPAIAGVPPTVTFAGPGGNSPIASPVRYPYTTTNVTKIGCKPTLRSQYGTDYYTNSVNGSWTPPPWAIEFVTSAADMAVWIRPENATTSFWITVDGQPTTRDPITPGNLSGGSLYYLRIQFVDSRPRTIRVHMNLADFGGLDVATGQTATATTPPGKKVAFLGDSWTEGTAQSPYPSTFSNVAARTLAWLPYLCGQGGTGYVANGGGGGKEVFGSSARLAAITTVAPDYIVIAGSQNDDGLSGIQAAAAALYSSLNTSLPSTKLIVIGPQPQFATTNRIANRDAVKAAALAAPNVAAFIDPIAQNWITGTGKLTARTGIGNADYVIGADGVHPSVFGGPFYGRRVAEEVIAALSAAGLAW